MKRRNWLLLLSAVILLVSAIRSLFEQHPSSVLRPPIGEAELGI